MRCGMRDLKRDANQLREQVYAGMKTLSEKQDKNGLTAAPPPNPRVVPEGTAAPDPTAVADPQKRE
jgi:hypothetical protein